ncbi:hypothetical protein E2L06_17250 [Haloterrigena sp. H1]|uniref:XdhC family protein n=1 Tax=Haloterrigena sp. H1 TaxID=2552943 RepID=UPI00110E6244|nr:XdhC family protein [Haloterrigena sp. H1]TMT81674.1 hypothetical protein E2L06_17250 [Haloterrigena sp. H1]
MDERSRAVGSALVSQILERIDVPEGTRIIGRKTGTIIAFDQDGATADVAVDGEKRFDEMREESADEGRSFTDAELERNYTPIGMSLGGDTPYQIAFSIVAELLAVAHDRTPQHLCRREEPIHDRVNVETD